MGQGKGFQRAGAAGEGVSGARQGRGFGGLGARQGKGFRGTGVGKEGVSGGGRGR